MEYNIVPFEPENSSFVTKDELEEFIEDAEFILCYDMAWHIDLIKGVGLANRGATLDFKGGFMRSGFMTHGYNVVSKFVKIK